MSILQLRKNHSHDESTLAATVVIKKGSSSEPTSIETLLPVHEHHDANTRSGNGFIPTRRDKNKVRY